ncbi:Tox-REase-5 domain-containing protein [Pyxidicoccus sp. MSG2]|uniref:Tox-REase-5 domain-containing protein n=1 Tax=Pyxidicoccus sp. MSG2 TaxID=2996790 RepID=UPI00226FDCE3|nr:Tox-REase-5 domain-containing protein [Pyxidicoccus sp. MSG2]MCY1022959.1 Tox-REase-5 domain-containing protein [Pyxidicoccus sp. MSG2]
MPAKALLLGVVLLATGCASLPPPSGRAGLMIPRQLATAPPVLSEERGPLASSPLPGTAAGEEVRGRHRRPVRLPATAVLTFSAEERTRRAVELGLLDVDAFGALLVQAGLEDTNALPPRDGPLTPGAAERLLGLLGQRPVTLGTFPPRMAAGHLLREVLEGGEVPRGELLRRVERFTLVAVLRPDGCLAWTRSGRTQQRVGPMEWREGALRAGPFELGHFYSGRGGAFRALDARLGEADGGVLAEVYDDADYLSRTLDGAEEAFVGLAEAVGQLLTNHPADTLAALSRLPSGLAALIASSPEYLERFRYMTEGEQVQEASKLLTNLIATWGAASATTRTLTSALAGAEATVPVLSLTAEGALVLERVAVPVGRAAAVLGGGPGAAVILHRTNTAAKAPAPSSGPGRWGPAKESMKPRSRAYQEQITGHSADDAYWVGGMSAKEGGVKFDGFKNDVLLEAKGPGYAKFFDGLSPKEWFKPSGARALIEQARRQAKKVEGMGLHIEWHVAEADAAKAIRKLLADAEIEGVNVVHTPAQ